MDFFCKAMDILSNTTDLLSKTFDLQSKASPDTPSESIKKEFKNIISKQNH